MSPLRCICEFPSVCDGSGSVDCDGCGGDFCVCACGGESVPCDGCAACADPDVDSLLYELGGEA